MSDAEIASLRASVERLTAERDEAREEVQRVTHEPEERRKHRASAISRAIGIEDESTTKQCAAIEFLRSRAESAEATIARLGMVVRAARELRTNYEDTIIGEWGPFDGPFRDAFTKPFDAALASLTPEDRRRAGIEG